MYAMTQFFQAVFHECSGKFIEGFRLPPLSLRRVKDYLPCIFRWINWFQITSLWILGELIENVILKITFGWNG